MVRVLGLQAGRVSSVLAVLPDNHGFPVAFGSGHDLVLCLAASCGGVGGQFLLQISPVWDSALGIV